ncbi:MAG TPA: CBS domain-containing protein [Thermoanaerobaculia bacterium]|nr:CBS domain-containing protein [Thermoanaerobaculia bacterium]
MAQQNERSGRGSQHIREVMTPNPECVTDKDTLLQAARIMRDKDTGVVPVVDGKKIVGLITDRDIVIRAIAEGKNIGDVRVSEVMTKNVKSVKEDSTVDEVLSLMGSAEIRRLPVVNTNNELVGIVSIGDVAAKTSRDDKVGKTVESISEAPPNR